MSNRYGPRIVTDGLVLCLDAADRNSYPLSGDIWYDLSGNTKDGTITGATYSSDTGGSFVFNGSSNINCGSSVTTGNNSFSWGAWINPSGTSGTPVFFGNNASTQAMVSYWDVATGKVRVGVWGSDKLTSTIAIASSTWGFTFWTWDGTTLTSYTNGVQSGTATGFSFNISSLLTMIGKANTSQPYYGKISLVQTYNRKLSANEVQQNYNATKGRFGL